MNSQIVTQSQDCAVASEGKEEYSRVTIPKWRNWPKCPEYTRNCEKKAAFNFLGYDSQTEKLEFFGTKRRPCRVCGYDSQSIFSAETNRICEILREKGHSANKSLRFSVAVLTCFDRKTVLLQVTVTIQEKVQNPLKTAEKQVSEKSAKLCEAQLEQSCENRHRRLAIYYDKKASLRIVTCQFLSGKGHHVNRNRYCENPGKGLVAPSRGIWGYWQLMVVTILSCCNAASPWDGAKIAPYENFRCYQEVS